MGRINTWWAGTPGERFWLGVTGRDGSGDVLAAPCDAGLSLMPRTYPLITHVQDGDVVFRFDVARQAIVAWSTARGRVQRRKLDWYRRNPDPERERTSPRPILTWVVELEPPAPLDEAVALDQVARIQWDLFPALRAFEDRVGEPLYYPFAMGSQSSTHLLAGYVFKLPALFIECFPSLTRVAEHVKQFAAVRARAAARVGSEEVAASPDARNVPAAARVSALLMR